LHQVDIFHEVAAPKTAYAFKEFLSAKKSLVSIRELKEGGSEVGPCGYQRERPVGCRKTKPEAAQRCRVIPAGPPEQVWKFGRGDGIVVQEEKDRTLGKHCTRVLLDSARFAGLDE
jgi:hypothetical protein